MALKLHKAASTDKGRRGLQFIHVTDGYAKVSDAHILLKIPVNEVFEGSTENFPDNFIVHKDDWNDMTKGVCTMNDDRESFLVQKGSSKKYVKIWKAEKFERRFEYFDETITIPDFDAVIPEGDAYECKEAHLDASKLKTIQDIFEQKDVTISFNGPRSAITVSHPDIEGMAIIMPVIRTNH